MQISLLKLFDRNIPENEILDLKKLMVSYYDERLKNELNRVVEEKGYTQEDFDRILNGDS